MFGEDTFEIITHNVLKKYKDLYREIAHYTDNNAIYYAILSAIALGDGRTHSTYKRARVSEEEGDKAINFLVHSGLIYREYAHEQAQREIHLISDKLHFTSPFLRFYFSSISPLYQGIKVGDYKEVEERFNARRQELVQDSFKKLSYEVVKNRFLSSDKIVEIGGYWDKEIELDIYAKTASGKTVVGICKYTNSKVKKSVLSELQQKCDLVGIKVDIFVIVSKNGFSNELKQLKSSSLMLLSLKNFRSLLE